MKKFLIIFLSLFILTSCGNNEEKVEADLFLKKYDCETTSDIYNCEKIGLPSINKSGFKVYNDTYFRDKNSIYKIENGKGEILLIETRKFNDIEYNYGIDGETLEYLGGDIIKDKNGSYDLKNYTNEPAIKIKKD